jgi:hypothetical protein
LQSHRIRRSANSPASAKAPHRKIFARCCESEKGDDHKEHRTCEPGRIANPFICPENGREVAAETGLGLEISAQQLVEKNGLDIGFEGLKIEKMRF